MKTDKLLPISAQNASLMMSSREIAELCEKEHRHVIRDIEVMFEQLEISSGGMPKFGHTPKMGKSIENIYCLKI